MKKRISIIFLILLVPKAYLSAQLIFEKSEYVQRREMVMAQIPEGIAIFRGALLPDGVSHFFQYNNMMYFSGLESPDIIFMVDGVTKTSTLLMTLTESGAKNEGISMDVVNDPGRFLLELKKPCHMTSSLLSL